MKITKILLVLLLLTSTQFWARGGSKENVIDEVVWVVGDEPILKSQIEEQYRNIQYEGVRLDGDPYCVIPEQMAIQKLFMTQARLDSVTVSDTDVSRLVEQRLNYFITNIGSKEKMQEYFNKSYTEIREQLTEVIREQGTVQEMQKKLVKDVKITPSEIRKHYAALPADSLPFVPTQVEVQIISLYPQVSQQEIENVKSRLREYSERINRGDSDFGVLARLYSQDLGSARNGGEMDFLGRAELVPQYANVAFALTDTRKVSKIVETEFGYHIIQLIEKRGDRIKTRHILLKPHIESTDYDVAKARLDSLINDMKIERITFDDAALYISQDKDTRYNKGLMVNNQTGNSRFEMQQLPQEVAKQVERLKEGEYSAPFVMMNARQGKEMVAIVKLKKRISGHRANLVDDYQLLKANVESQKRDEFLRDWIRKKQGSTYIRIKEGWRNCDFKHEGWVIQQ